jgi:hypothetical protein
MFLQIFAEKDADLHRFRWANLRKEEFIDEIDPSMSFLFHLSDFGFLT